MNSTDKMTKPKTACDVCGKQFINVAQHKTKTHVKHTIVIHRNSQTLELNGEYRCKFQGSSIDGTVDWDLFLDGQCAYVFVWRYGNDEWEVRHADTSRPKPVYKKMFDVRFEDD